MADKEWSFRLGLGRDANDSPPLKINDVTKSFTKTGGECSMFGRKETWIQDFGEEN